MFDYKQLRLKIEYVKPEELRPRPNNPRFHPQDQIDDLKENIKKVGFIVPILVNEQNEIIAGHGRIEAALQLEMDEIPAIRESHLTSDQVREFVIFDNKITERADWDLQALNREIIDIAKAQGNSLEEVSKSIGFDQREILEIAPALGDGIFENEEFEDEEEEEKIDTSKFDVGEYFPSSNQYELPDLDPDMLSDQVPTICWDEKSEIEFPEQTLCTWHGIKGKHFTQAMCKGGVICFYDDDHKFESIWNDPIDAIVRLMKNEWGSVVMPDFSVWKEQPYPIQLMQMYKSYWCARFFQKHGIKIIPNITYTDRHSLDFSFKGIPKGAPLIMCQMRTTGWGGKSKEDIKKRAIDINGLLYAIDEIQPKGVIFYGGKRHRKKFEPSLPKGIDYYFIGSRMDARLEAYQNEE